MRSRAILPIARVAHRVTKEVEKMGKVLPRVKVADLPETGSFGVGDQALEVCPRRRVATMTFLPAWASEPTLTKRAQRYYHDLVMSRRVRKK
ncbi:MAG TPA: hypothetical protein VN495_03650 [Candidatus Paceibacterota bacterium]|nr:hypothetical protein [Candidatus Paceibacterota bacterium]